MLWGNGNWEWVDIERLWNRVFRFVEDSLGKVEVLGDLVWYKPLVKCISLIWAHTCTFLKLKVCY